MATKSVTFRCPDELLEYINQQVEEKGIDRTTVIVELLQAGVEASGGEGVTGIGHPLGNVRQLIQQAIMPIQAQLDELKGKLAA